jgi:hypothetical protein
MRIIDADKYQKELLSAYDDVSMEFEVLDRQPLVSAIPIPEGATNGDMIKAMFPNIECRKDELGNVFIISSAQLGYIALRESWWNTPYKGGCNLSEKSTGSESEDWE